MVVGAVMLAACASDDDTADEDASSGDDTSDGPAADAASPSDPEPDEETESKAVPQADESPRREDVPSGLQAALTDNVEDVPAPTVPIDELLPGGPPPDGIPAIDEPQFLVASDVDFLADEEPVLALEIDGESRAYPVQILIWHEIVNDTVADVPVAVTYCPLCNTALAYDRHVDGRVVTFGTSGLLWNSALVMYDRQTETLWSHFNGEGIVGELTGVELETYPIATVPWNVWRDENPEGLVLSRDTGFERAYGNNPYPGYDNVNSDPFLFEGEVDGRFTAMTRLVGIERDGAPMGVPLPVLREQRVVPVELAGTELVVWWEPGTSSALDSTDIASGDDVGASGVFDPVVDDQPLTFTATDDGFIDDQTGSMWNVLGKAVGGELEGEQLEAVPHVDTFWFAWSSFHPDTDVADGE